MPVPKHDEALVDFLRRRGLKHPRWMVEEARTIGLPLAYALAFLEKESTGRDRDGTVRFGLNLFGHDPVANPVRGGVVTHRRYDEYKAHRRRGLGMQGVGPMQLTWWEFQDIADEEG